jgi:hypothetical protein
VGDWRVERFRVRYIHDRRAPGADGWSDGAITLPFVIYLFAAARRTYAESGWRTAFKALVLTGWAIAVLTAYRFVLFFTSFYAI